MTSVTTQPRRGFTFAQYLICMGGIIWAEALRFVHQRGRFVSALVRPAGLALHLRGRLSFGARRVDHSAVPDLHPLRRLHHAGSDAMIQLFNGMQSSLSMVYDRETGNMRTLLVSPLPRWYLLTSKLLAGTAVSILQVYAYLLIAYFWGIEPDSLWGYLTVLPALLLSGLMLGALGMALSSMVRQLENFAGVMNFVIFPMFFASSALYPLWKVQEGSPWLATVCQFNPFTYAVELIRFALYLQVDWLSLGVVAGCLVVFLGAAILAYDPSRGMLIRRGGAAE